MELRQKMADMGYFGIGIPEEYGGLGLGAFEYCLVAEQLARGWMSVASIMARGQAGWLRLGGSVSPKNADRMRRAARGEFLQAAALSEPGTGSDLASISCRAVRDGDEWVITGNKYWCTFADGADYITVFARTSTVTFGRQTPSRNIRFHDREAAWHVAAELRRHIRFPRSATSAGTPRNSRSRARGCPPTR